MRRPSQSLRFAGRTLKCCRTQVGVPTNPPTSAPAMPSKIVTMIPPGSLPGMTILANNPATSPRTIHVTIPMVISPVSIAEPCRAAERIALKLRRAEERFIP